MSWLLMRAALTGWPQPFNGKPTDTPFLSLKWLLISSSPALYPLRPNQFATLEHFKTDITAFTQTCWSLLWDQFRGSGDPGIWKHQSKSLRWALTYRDPRSSWSQSAEENSTTGFRNHWERGPMTAGAGRYVSSPSAAWVYWFTGDRGRSCSTITCCCCREPVPPARG